MHPAATSTANVGNDRVSAGCRSDRGSIYGGSGDDSLWVVLVHPLPR